ncbi:hypothetical protein CQ011_15795 [Arthrobacter sp. MYb213]|nr:hypothetical protein CQ011_15795 [Arthrobacter sp. MYb213]
MFKFCNAANQSVGKCGVLLDCLQLGQSSDQRVNLRPVMLNRCVGIVLVVKYDPIIHQVQSSHALTLQANILLADSLGPN